MQAVKRLEIIASSPELHKILDALDAAGVPDYSVLRDVTGKGRGGAVSDDSDLAATTLSNVYILAFCPEADVEAAIDRLRPVLGKFGGSLFVSDAQALQALRCVASPRE